jgi:pimeloyl-ACP methyl ester carboxylesterase
VKEKTEVGRVNAAVEAQNVEIDKLPIRYLAAGEGPPLVLLHGAGDNALDWRWVMPSLAATHRVYAPDLSGSPDSARPAADYSPVPREASRASGWPSSAGWRDLQATWRPT